MINILGTLGDRINIVRKLFSRRNSSPLVKGQEIFP